MKSSIKKTDYFNGILLLLAVLYAVYSLEPYFTWRTYNNGIFGYLLGSVPLRTIFGILFIAAFFVISKGRVRCNKYTKYLAVGVFICAIFCVAIAGGTENTHLLSMSWIPYLVVIFYLFLPHDMKIKAYNLYFLFFVITLIIPMLCYVMHLVGHDLPYSILQPQEEIKVIRGFYYKNYFGAVQRVHNYDLLSEMKLCGIYDESGRLGTLAALFLIGERLNFKNSKNKWKCIICLIAGIMSFSLAFYLIIFIYYAILCVFNRKFKNILVVLLAIVIYLGFVSIPLKDGVLKNLQSRITITESGLNGDNRTNEQFDELIEEFNENSSLYSLAFGYGDGSIAQVQISNNIDGSSYKSFIYNYGYIGFASLILWLILYGLFNAKSLRMAAHKAQVWAIVIAYIMNIYQRPTSFYLGYLMIMIGAIEIIRNEEEGLLNDKRLQK